MKLSKKYGEDWHDEGGPCVHCFNLQVNPTFLPISVYVEVERLNFGLAKRLNDPASLPLAGRFCLVSLPDAKKGLHRLKQPDPVRIENPCSQSEYFKPSHM
jgi:hypothetical protein